MRSYANPRTNRLFVSVKCARAIPARAPLLRDYLIQSTLDPAITAIDYIPASIVDNKAVDLNAVVVERDGVRLVVDLVGERPLRSIDDEGMVVVALRSLGLGIMTVSADDIRAEPRLTNCREIWSHRSTNPTIEDRAAIVDAIERSGPITTAELRALVRTTKPIAACIYALVCEGALVIDVSSPLGRQSLVSIGRFPAGTASRNVGSM